MNMKKNFNTIEVINIVSFINNVMTDEQKNALPTKVKWYLKKNMDKLVPIAKNFEEFRDGEVATLQKDWFTDEKSEEYTEVKKGENDEDINVPMRKIKAEYMDEYNNAVNDLNAKLQEILMDNNVVEIATFDMDSFVENMPDDSPVDFDCLNILSFMDETTGVVREEAE